MTSDGIPESRNDVVTSPREIPDDDVRTILRIRSLSLAYGSRRALQDVDLKIVEGEVLAIVGPSGAGKSSLLQSINRITDLIPDARLSGRISLDGVDTLSPSCDVSRLRRRIGMIFQRPNPFPMSIRRNIEFPLKEHGVRDRARRREMTEKSLTDVGLWEEVRDRLDQPATELSGGQQQRLCLARALALEPEILLLDEPCSSLDPPATETIERLFERLRGRLTLIVVTHNLAQARRIADRVAVLWNCDGAGKVIEVGPTRQVFEAPVHPSAAAYLQGRTG